MPLRAGEADDVVDGEEIGGEAQPGDERQLVVEGGADLLRHAGGEAPAGAVLGQPLQRLLGAGGIAGRLVGILVAELVEGEGEALEHGGGLGEAFRKVAEEAGHLRRRLQVAFGIGGEQAAGIGQRLVLADAGEDVLQAAALGRVIEHVVGGHQRHGEAFGQAREQGHAAMVAGPVIAAEHQADSAGEGVAERGEGRVERRRRVRSGTTPSIRPSPQARRSARSRKQAPLGARRLPSVRRRHRRP